MLLVISGLGCLGKIGETYRGHAVGGINISKYALEFKINEVRENNISIPVNYEMDTMRNCISVEYTPTKTGKKSLKQKVQKMLDNE